MMSVTARFWRSVELEVLVLGVVKLVLVLVLVLVFDASTSTIPELEGEAGGEDVNGIRELTFIGEESIGEEGILCYTSNGALPGVIRNQVVGSGCALAPRSHSGMGTG